MVIALDDTRYDHLFGYLNNDTTPGKLPPGRAGQLIMHNFWTRIAPYSMKYGCHGTTFGPCWPSRTEWFTGYTYMNHMHTSNSISAYHQLYDQGEKKSFALRPTPQWLGPLNMSLAAIQGFGSSRVPHASQIAMGVLRPDPANPSGIPHDPDDDLQLWTGSIFQEISRRAMLMFGMKYQNAYRGTDPIPAGVHRWRGGVYPDSLDQYSLNIIEKDCFAGENPFNGVGVSPPPNTPYVYDRGANVTLDSFTIVSGAGRVRLTSVTAHKFRTQDIGTYCVQITGTSPYVGLWKLVQIDTNTKAWFEFPTELDPSSVLYPSNTLFPSGSPAGSGTATGHLWNRHQYPLIHMAEEVVDFVDIVQSADENCVIWICPHQTHAVGDEIPADESTATFEKCYIESVDPQQANYFDGVSGAQSPNSPNPVTVSTQQVWQYIMQMMASVDDFLGIILDKLDAVWPGNYHIIFTSDQGVQIVEQYQRVTGIIKTCVWEGSRRAPCYVMGPGITPGVFNRPTMHADIPLTILDILGDTTNHMHLRDGVSLLRIIDPSYVAYERLCVTYGDFKGQNGEAALWPDGVKFVRVDGLNTGGKIYDWRLPSQGGDYETAEIDVVDVDPVYYRSKMNALRGARFDYTTESNPFHDGRIVV